MAYRYTYATAATLADAQDLLEDCYANAEVSACEHPRIERQATYLDHRTGSVRHRYAITLED